MNLAQSLQVLSTAGPTVNPFTRSLNQFDSVRHTWSMLVGSRAYTGDLGCGEHRMLSNGEYPVVDFPLQFMVHRKVPVTLRLCGNKVNFLRV